MLCILVAAPARAQDTLLVLGDSLSAAYGMAREEGWVALLEARLARERRPYRVVNASISGETTSGGAARIEALLMRHRPRIVIIELGANDGLRGLDLATTRANLDAMIRRARQHGARVLLIGMRLPPNYGPDYTEKFHRLYGELAQRHRVALVPFLLAPIAGRRDYFQADGLHPTAAAQPLLLDTVWPTLEPLLRREPVATAPAGSESGGILLAAARAAH